jgi:hypothetical protein
MPPHPFKPYYRKIQLERLRFLQGNLRFNRNTCLAKRNRGAEGEVGFIFVPACFYNFY